jgi:G patch domain-containing protein 1
MSTQKRSRADFEADLQAKQSPYALFGTPLAPLDPDVRDDGSFVPVWKQEVTDERGRKRLHGAFQGGFSAGYFNTVGSKEGWTPSTFVSSRTNRAKDAAKHAQQRPEDYMDEEDLAEAEEAKHLETSVAFASLGEKAGELGNRGDFVDLLVASGDTMGYKLLRKMGWKDGQGVGPRVLRKARDDDDLGARDEEAVHAFAPENSSMIKLQKKHNQKGLGFQDEEALSRVGVENVLLDTKSANAAPPFDIRPVDTKKKPSTKKSAFGVGVLNDTGSDDEDPYAIGPQISYSRTLGGDKKKKKKKDVGQAVLLTSLGGAKHAFIPKKVLASRLSTNNRKCHDGRLPLDGFILATNDNSQEVSNDELHSPPAIPKDWQSAKSTVFGPQNGGYQSAADASKLSKLDPVSRAKLLGESALPGKSVFDFLSPAARDRVASASGKISLPQGRGESAPEGYVTSDKDRQKSLWGLVPELPKEVAIQALARGVGGWMPYAEDESKRARYRAFLESKSEINATLPTRAEGSSLEDWSKELKEFARAAEVFRPVSGLMSKRFTSSTTELPVGPARSIDGEESLLTVPSIRPEDPAEAAAKLGMFGPMTHSTTIFLPSRLLCKRFNVKAPPHLQAEPTPGNEAGGYAPSAPNMDRQLVREADIDELIRQSRPIQTSTDKPKEEMLGGPGHQKLVKLDTQRNEALEQQRPNEDVFKAIFGSDDDDDD